MTYTDAVGEVSAWHRGADGAERVEFASGTMGTFIAPGSDTAGRYGLFRWNLPPRASGADPHFHRTFSEAFFVLAGEVALFDGARWIEVGAGDFLYVPERGVHAFRNETSEAASMLILFAPGAPREQYFRELAEIGRTGRSMSAEERRDFLARHDQYAVEVR